MFANSNLNQNYAKYFEFYIFFFEQDLELLFV